MGDPLMIAQCTVASCFAMSGTWTENEGKTRLAAGLQTGYHMHGKHRQQAKPTLPVLHTVPQHG